MIGADDVTGGAENRVSEPTEGATRVPEPAEGAKD